MKKTSKNIIATIIVCAALSVIVFPSLRSIDPPLPTIIIKK